MLDPYLGLYRRVIFVAAVLVLGCNSENTIFCPAPLEACPSTLPDNGAPCAERGSAALCEYGDDPWYGCNTIAYCDSQGGWFTVAPARTDCPSTLTSGCPTSFAEAMSSAGNACAAALSCRYPEGNCRCTAAGLACSAPPAANCPATRPQAGTACSAPCTTWGSGLCDGQSMKCICGTWQPIQCAK